MAWNDKQKTGYLRGLLGDGPPTVLRQAVFTSQLSPSSYTALVGGEGSFKRYLSPVSNDDLNGVSVVRSKRRRECCPPRTTHLTACYGTQVSNKPPLT